MYLRGGEGRAGFNHVEAHGEPSSGGPPAPCSDRQISEESGICIKLNDPRLASLKKKRDWFKRYASFIVGPEKSENAICGVGKRGSGALTYRDI